MRSVWKFSLPLLDGARGLNIPAGADVVHVAAQDGEVMPWAIVSTYAATEKREFVIHGTGHPVADDERYVGTAHVPPFVWHVFEVVS